jgi:hypothetical protein
LHKESLASISKDIYTDMVAIQGEICFSLYTTVKCWVVDFKHDRQSIEDGPHVRGPSTDRSSELVSKVQYIVMTDKRVHW